MSQINCNACAYTHKIEQNILYSCPCGQGIAKADCIGCGISQIQQFECLNAYSQEFKCLMCELIMYLTPCPECQANDTFIRCKCQKYLYIINCQACTIPYVLVQNTIIENLDGMILQCPICESKSCALRCLDCRKLNQIQNFNNQGVAKCQFCKKQITKIYCSSCKQTNVYTSDKITQFPKRSVLCLNRQCLKLIKYGPPTGQVELIGVSTVPTMLTKEAKQQSSQDQLLDVNDFFTQSEQIIQPQQDQLIDVNDFFKKQKQIIQCSNPDNTLKCKLCRIIPDLVLNYPCGHKPTCRDCVQDKCYDCDIEIRNTSSRKLMIKQICILMLEEIAQLNRNGFYRKAYSLLQDLAKEYLAHDPNFVLLQPLQCTIPEISQYYLEYANISLKLSLLDNAKQAIKCCLFYPRTTDQIIQIALIYQRIDYWLCKYTQSINLLKNVLTLVPENDWETRGEIYNQITNALRAWCCQDQAEEWINKALKIYPDIQNPIIRSNILYVKARLYMDTERSKEGVEFALECLNIRMKYYQTINDQHADIALAYELVGKLFFSLNDIQAANYNHEIAYQMKVQIFGIYNFETIDSINEKGRLQLTSKKEKQAIENFKLIGEVSKVLLGDVNQYLALSYNNLGCALYNQAEYELSIIEHQKALKIYEELCGRDHQKLYFSLNQMASANKMLSRIKMAHQIWSRCLSILEKCNQNLFQKQIVSIRNQLIQFEKLLED